MVFEAGWRGGNNEVLNATIYSASHTQIGLHTGGKVMVCGTPYIGGKVMSDHGRLLPQPPEERDLHSLS